MVLNNPPNIMYRAFGFNIFSGIPLPELIVGNQAEKADVVIKKSKPVKESDENKINELSFEIARTCIKFNLPKIGHFTIKNGEEILIKPFKGVKDDWLRLYILGTCMGAVMIQRRILPLHGSAIEIDGKAYAIVGDSGAGKSTTASSLLAKGFKLLSDDVIPVTLSDKNIPMVTPAYPQQKLWQKSIDAFGMESSKYRPIVDRENKFAIPVHSQFINKKLPLAGIFELVKSENEEVEMQEMNQLERFHTLYHHTYRNFLLQPAGLMEWHFNMCVNMVNKFEVFQIKRPVSHFTAHEITSLILSSIEKEAVV